MDQKKRENNIQRPHLLSKYIDRGSFSRHENYILISEMKPIVKKIEPL